MIRVGFIGAVSKEWMGALNYFKNLLFAISSQENKSIEVVVFLGKNTEESIKKMFSEYAIVIEDSLFDRQSLSWYAWKILAKVFKSQYFLDQLLKKHEIEILSHSYMTGLKNCKTINWIPDFQHKHLPQMFSSDEIIRRDFELKTLSEESDRIVLSSYDAYKDYCEYAPLYKEKARVLQFVSQPSPNFFDLTPNDEYALRLKYHIKGKYFYLPNQFWKHKNHSVAFEAVKILKNEGLEVKLVCSGYLQDYRNLDHVDRLQNYIQENQLEQNIHLLGLVDYKDVFALIKFSEAVLNPSLFEGWSSTVEECKSVGKKMILSDLSVHQEQYPQALFFEKNNAHSLAQSIKESLANSEQGLNNFNVHDETKKFAKKFIQIVQELV